MGLHPFFSICIPQYNRTSFVVEAIRSIERQTYRDVEICISDDCSTDGREQEIRDALGRTGLSFIVRRRPSNGGYDRNLRAAMDLARGDFLLLLGNDDALTNADTLARVRAALAAHPEADVLIPNFEDFTTGVVTRRVESTRLAGSGPRTAVAAFRKFSFVSGIVIRRAAAASARTDAWDGSEMYQMYLGCRAIASGGALVELDDSAIRKDIRIAGEAVDSLAARPREALRGIPRQPIPVTEVARLVAAAIAPYVQSGRRPVFGSLVMQYYGFLFPYWLLVYRRLQSWRFAAGVARAFAPSDTLRDTAVPASVRAMSWALFVAASIVGLATPVRLTDVIVRPARRLARAAAALARPTAEVGRP